ncbi:unnamed protein product [Caenorhabditis bovis]|uniref:Hcy-binding domain-containing protein n=1 Tax=Caenorhabditis bovis TaxID=2654633 RepID=A0A8S1EEG0_9PELO|nr:unnamed protein product [Caenorhabditis bovis]
MSKPVRKANVIYFKILFKMAPNLRMIDGSMSATLKQFGFDAFKKKPHWTFAANSDKELMRKVYQSFADMNLDYITTNTYHYGSTFDPELPPPLKDRWVYDQYFKDTCDLLEDIIEKHNKTGKHKIKILGSVGSLATRFHDCSEYHGRYVEQASSMTLAREHFASIFESFMSLTNIRTLIIETLPTGLEGEVVLELLEKFPELQVVVSFTFKVIGFGINCTDPQNVVFALEQASENRFRDIFVYPNVSDAFFVEDEDNLPPPFSEALVKSWAEKGATVFGGCCGVDTDYLRILKNIIDKFNEKA